MVNLGVGEQWTDLLLFFFSFRTSSATKKKVSEWYNQFKASRAESSTQRQNNTNNQAHYDDGYRCGGQRGTVRYMEGKQMY